MNDPYEVAYEEFRNRRMKPRRYKRMNDETKDIELTAENIAIYEEAARLYKDGNKEDAVAHVKDNLGEEAAKEAEAVMAEADKLQGEAQGEEAKAATEEETSTDDSTTEASTEDGETSEESTSN